MSVTYIWQHHKEVGDKNYENTGENAIKRHEKHEEKEISRKFLFRQIMICSVIWVNYLSLGLCIGAPTVIIPQLRREADSKDAISQEMVSWLSSTVSYSGSVLVIVYTVLPKYVGRKSNLLLTSTISLLGFLILYFSKTVAHIIIGEIFEGVLPATQVTLNMMVISEYSSPRYRGIFLTIKSAMFFWGIWISNTVGTFFHWKYIPLIGCIASFYNMVLALYWPESPYWLAAKNRLDECSSSHYWLKGKMDESQRELENIIRRQTSAMVEKEKSKGNWLKKCYTTICCKRFYKPILISIMILNLYNGLGKITCTVYAIDIIKKITGSESAAYKGMLLLDAVTIVGIHAGCIISRFVSRKPMLIITSGFGIFSLFSLSIYLYSVSNLGISENVYVSLFILISFTLSVSSGPFIMCSSLISEVMPLTFRNTFSLIVGIYMNCLFGTFLKLAPFLFSSVGMSGSFFMYALISSFSLILTCKMLPETKDKTLLEIEKSFRGNINRSQHNHNSNNITV